MADIINKPVPWNLEKDLPVLSPLVYEAVSEIESIVRMLQRQTQDTIEFEFLLRGSLHRIGQLNGVVCSVHGGDTNNPIEALYEVVHCKPMEVAHG